MHIVRYSQTPVCLREAELITMFLVELSSFRKEWQVSLADVLQKVLSSAIVLLDTCVSFLIRPRLLAHLIEVWTIDAVSGWQVAFTFLLSSSFLPVFSVSCSSFLPFHLLSILSPCLLSFFLRSILFSLFHPLSFLSFYSHPSIPFPSPFYSLSILLPSFHSIPIPFAFLPFPPFYSLSLFFLYSLKRANKLSISYIYC